MTTHADTASAVHAIARVLRSPPSTDPEITAAHVLEAIRGLGWRPTNVVTLPAWSPPPPIAEARVHELADQARKALAREDGP